MVARAHREIGLDGCGMSRQCDGGGSGLGGRKTREPYSENKERRVSENKTWRRTLDLMMSSLACASGSCRAHASWKCVLWLFGDLAVHSL